MQHLGAVQQQADGAHGLAAACARLEELGVVMGGDQTALCAALEAVRQVCNAFVGAVASGQASDVQSMRTVLQALSQLSKVLQAAEACVSSLTAHPAFEDAALWSGSILPLVDTVLFSERWHRAVKQLQTQGDLGKQLQDVTKSIVREVIMPLLCCMAAKRPMADSKSWASTYSEMLDLGVVASALAGYQGSCSSELLLGRTTSLPYVALNATWHGIAQLWTATPQVMRRQLQEEGLGVGHLLKLLCGFLKQDMDAFSQRVESSVTVSKRIQFWLMLVNKLAVACPEACSAGWEVLLKWHVSARRTLSSLSHSQHADDLAASELAEAEIFARASKFLVLMLNNMAAEETLKVAVDRLRARMLSTGEASDHQQALALPTLLAALDVLQSAAFMKPQVRRLCVQLLPGVLDALIMPTCTTIALEQPSVLQRVAEGFLTFMAACCSNHGRSEQDCETWLHVQRQLFLLALRPHPVIADVLAQCWGDTIRLCDVATLEQHIEALHALLHAAVIAQGTGYTECPLVAQLASLLSCLICSSPEGVAEHVLHNALQVLPLSLAGADRLSCLATDLCVVTLTDAATGSISCCSAVLAILQQLAMLLQQQVNSGEALQRLVQQPADSPEARNFMWLLECIRLGTDYLATTKSIEQVDISLVQSLAADLVQVAVSLHSSTLPCWSPSALRTLASLPCDQVLSATQLDALLPALEAYQKHPETAACAAAVAPAFRLGTVAPRTLIHAALGDGDPVMQFVGMEAYVGVIRKCDRAWVLLLLPPAMLDPGTGAVAAKHTAILTQHLGRCPSEGQLGNGGQLHKWAAALHGAMEGAAAQLTTSAKACVAQQVQGLAGGGAGAAAAGPLPAEEAAARSALCGAVELMWQAAESSSMVLDASTVQALQQCTARLRSILTAHGVQQ